MQAIRWEKNRLVLLDQRRLPQVTHWQTIDSWQQAAAAIRDMVVRGAPAIAITAAYGMALAVQAGAQRETAHRGLLAARPTAVNLRWALERLAALPDDEVCRMAQTIHAEDLQINQAIGQAGAHLLEGGVITICNTGALATGGHGTALGMIRSAQASGRALHVYVLETRPYLQGARLTVFECKEDGIPCTLITDSMAGALLASGRVNAAVVGCDRVAANGDTANKIGTYSLAVLCRHHSVPLYVAMPVSTLDSRCPDGRAIPIEERAPEEVTEMAGSVIAPSGTCVWNPAFDITPAHLIAGWVTEHGIWRTPFEDAGSTPVSTTIKL